MYPRLLGFVRGFVRGFVVGVFLGFAEESRLYVERLIATVACVMCPYGVCAPPHPTRQPSHSPGGAVPYCVCFRGSAVRGGCRDRPCAAEQARTQPPSAPPQTPFGLPSPSPLLTLTPPSLLPLAQVPENPKPYPPWCRSLEAPNPKSPGAGPWKPQTLPPLAQVPRSPKP